MTKRAFAVEDLVQLPRLSATDGVTVIHELVGALATADRDREEAERARKGKKKGANDPALLAAPDNVRASLRRLADTGSALDRARAARQREAPKPPDKRKADVRVDRAWGTLLAWMNAVCALEDGATPSVEEMQRVRDRVFPGPERLGFLSERYKRQWKLGEDRTEVIEREGLAATIDAFGGARFLRNVVAAQQAYGAAVGMTAPVAPAAPKTPVRPALDAVLAALRDYVLKVRALADPDVPGSEALADRLLHPFVEWIEKSVNAPVTADEDEGEDDEEPEGGGGGKPTA